MRKLIFVAAVCLVAAACQTPQQSAGTATGVVAGAVVGGPVGAVVGGVAGARRNCSRWDPVDNLIFRAGCDP